jgi:hypothetical protein
VIYNAVRRLSFALINALCGCATAASPPVAQLSAREAFDILMTEDDVHSCFERASRDLTMVADDRLTLKYDKATSTWTSHVRCSHNTHGSYILVVISNDGKILQKRKGL